MFQRLNHLMEGNTDDLENEVTFTSEAIHLMQTKMHLDNLTKEDVIRFMGIKRTNASTLMTIGLLSLVVLEVEVYLCTVF